MCPSDRQNRWVCCADGVRFLAHAARYDHAAILVYRFANGGKAFFLGAVEEAASVDQHYVCARIIGAHRVTVCAQAGEDAL